MAINIVTKEYVDSAKTALSTNITNEINARTTADTELQSKIDAEISRATAAEKVNADAISKEASDRTNADNTLQENINKEITDREEAVKINADAIINEIADRQDAIYSVEQQVENERTNRISVVKDLQTYIDNEVKRAKEAEAANESLITKEINERKAAMDTKQDKFGTYTVTEGQGILAPDADVLSIEGKTITLSGNGEGIHSQVTVSANSTQIEGQSVYISSTDGTHISNVIEPVENTDAVNKEYVDNTKTTLSGDISTETSERKEDVKTLTNNLANEAATRSTNDTTLQTNIDNVGNSVTALSNSVYTKSDTYNKEEIDQKVAGAFKFKGEKASKKEVEAITDAQSGDVWQVGEKEYAYNGTTWVELGFNVNLTAYAKTEDVNTNITNAKTEAINESKTYTDNLVGDINTVLATLVDITA